MRGRIPARTSAPRRSRSTTRLPASDAAIRSRRASESASVAPRRRNWTLARASASSWRRPMRPARYAARPNWNAEDPCMRVLSRSKKAALRAPRPAPGCGSPGAPSAAIDLDDDRVALATARADRGAAEAAAAAAQLVDEGPEDARPGGADGVA